MNEPLRSTGTEVYWGERSTSLHLKSRTQDSLFMSWPNMLRQGGSEIALFYVND